MGNFCSHVWYSIKLFPLIISTVLYKSANTFSGCGDEVFTKDNNELPIELNRPVSYNNEMIM